MLSYFYSSSIKYEFGNRILISRYIFRIDYFGSHNVNPWKNHVSFRSNENEQTTLNMNILQTDSFCKI